MPGLGTLLWCPGGSQEALGVCMGGGAGQQMSMLPPLVAAAAHVTNSLSVADGVLVDVVLERWQPIGLRV